MDPHQQPTDRRFSRQEYERMAGLGFFDDERVELLFGRVVPMSPQGGRHALVCERLIEGFVLQGAGRVRVRPAMPYGAAPDSMPEPDVALFPREYGPDHPTEPLLVVEVSHSSLAQDTQLKGRLYAQAGVPEYWVVDLQHDVVRVHSGPRDGRWTSVVEVDRGTLTCQALPGFLLEIAALLA